MAESKYYEHYYPGPFKPVPSLEEIEGGGGSGIAVPSAKANLLEGNDGSGGFKPVEFETEGEGSKYPAAR